MIDLEDLEGRPDRFVPKDLRGAGKARTQFARFLRKR